MGNQNEVAFIALPAFLCHGVIGQVGRNTGGCTTTHPPVFRVPCSDMSSARGGLEGVKPPPFGAERPCRLAMSGRVSRAGTARSNRGRLRASPSLLFLFGVVQVVRPQTLGAELTSGWDPGESSGQKGRDTASLPWSPDPRPGPGWAWKGVWGRAPRRSARPTVGPSGARNEVRGGPRTEWRKGGRGAAPPRVQGSALAGLCGTQSITCYT